MALRPQRQIHQTTMDFILTQAAEPGTALVASGVATPTAAIADASLLTVGSGVAVLGLLLNTRESMNFAIEYERRQYDTDDLNTIVSIVRDGEVETNLVVQNAGNIEVGDAAYLAADGNVGNFNHPGVSGVESRLRIGQFLSRVDTDGFVRLRVNLG